MCKIFLLKILRGCPKALQNTLLFPYAIYLIQISKNELGNSQKNQKKENKKETSQIFRIYNNITK